MLAAALISLWITRDGSGWDGDSSNYLYTARSYVESGVMLTPDHGGGLVPLRHWPPLYPFMLAALMRLTGDTATAACWLNAIIFPLNILIMAGLAYRLRFSLMTGVIVCLVFTLAPVILAAHVTAMSEALCLTFWLASLFFLLEYQRKETWGLLVAAAVATAATVMCRYLGGVQVIVGIPFIAFYTLGSWRKKLTRAAVYMLFAVGPLLLWLGRSHSSEGTALVDRKVGFYGVSMSQLNLELAAWARWVAPIDGHSWMKTACIVLIVFLGLVCAVRLYRNKGKAEVKTSFSFKNDAASILLLAGLIVNEFVILFVALFADPTMDMSERMHITSFVFILLLVGHWSSRWMLSASTSNGFGKICLQIWIVLVVGVYLVSGLVWIGSARDSHLDGNNSEWHKSEGIALLQRRYATVPIYTNNFSLIYLYTGRIDSRNLTSLLSDSHNASDPQASQNFAEMIKNFTNDPRVIVYFKNYGTQSIPLGKLRQSPALTVIDETDDMVFLSANVK